MTFFVGFGGVEVFVRVLCEPPRLFERHNHYYYPRSDLVQILMMVMKILTEVLLNHTELSWVLYDRFPGVFFRLLELIGVPSLRQAATPLLEHLISNLGPIFEIARTPLLIKLLHAKDEGVLASVYRVVALLVVPFLALSHSPLPSRHLLHPESMLLLKRVQRVIDSNVLWLLAQPNLMDRLIKLCEIRVSGIRMLNGHYITLVTPYAANMMRNYLNQANPLLNASESMLISSIEGGYFQEEEGEMGGEGGFDGVMGSFWHTLGTLPSLEPLVPGFFNLMANTNDVTDIFENVNNVISGGMLGFFDQSVEETIQTSNPIPEDAFRVDFSWFLGVSDARQRWRLQDLTLTMAEDDTRPQLYYGYGDSETVQRFYLNNQAVINWIAAKPSLTREVNEYLRLMTLRSVVESQSEILFVLNVMLSTFSFSDAWTKIKDCRWIPRADRIYDTAFFLNEELAPLVELPQHVELPDWLRKLPRFQPSPPPFSDESAKEGEESEKDPNRKKKENFRALSSLNTSDLYPAHWKLRPFHAFFNSEREAYAKDFSASMLHDQDDFCEDKHHYQHGADTIRKLELIHCIHEFWNMQDRQECTLLHSEDIPQYAKSIAAKMARSLASGKEESCVEAALSHTLEGYLRCFSFPYGINRNALNSPQTLLGAILLRSILEHRIYNTTRLPGYMGSLKPLKRFEAIFSLTAELVRYHFRNLRLLVAYVSGENSLIHLNDPKMTRRSPHIIFHFVNTTNNNDNNDGEDGNHDARYYKPYVEFLESPPLERCEFEPFGCILLSRLFRFGCEANLFIRAIMLSITPGLRSSQNYIAKAFPNIEDTQPTVLPVRAYNHVGDPFTAYPMRLAYIRQVSRKYVLSINKVLSKTRAIQSLSSTLKGKENLQGDGSDLTSIPNLLISLLDELLNAPHRLALKERPFPNLFSEDDRRFLRGENIDNNNSPNVEGNSENHIIFGPPPHWRLPLFSEDDFSDARDLRELNPLDACLFAQPYKLLFSILSPLNAELMMSTTRLCAITTVLLLFLREAHLQCRISAIDDILHRLRPLAERRYRKWQRKSRREKARHDQSPKDSLKNVQKAHSLCTECESTRSMGGGGRCSTFLAFGECFPLNEARLYYLCCGGCFYRNFFRLLCVWTGHYATCQNYLETLYFSTEVAFAEYKTVLLYLLRVLPNYFFPSMN
ncbi:unnamed protein product [Phytomonas sp. Hart1]|nr:unnamed protein product [Phytomonas sp. Hart1]|eukprot:CCW68635.1 unnamed protein product [Phytomonas sp. isolate Hart1]